MNQICKVCGEPAAGFHFGAFTCEGCKSFFGRSYNNVNSISECKNNNKCIINKKNRTACKACRLLKCLKVGMSKSGSRYGRRSNWFKIHCLLAEQQQQQDKQHQHQQQQQHNQENSARNAENNVRGEIATTSSSNSNNTSMVLPTQMLTYNPSSLFGSRHEDLIRMQMETHFQQHFQHHHHHHHPTPIINNNNNTTSSPSVSSPESSHNSESSSVDFNNETTRRIPLMQNLLPPFIPHPSFFIPQYALYQSGLLPSPVGFPTAPSHNSHNNNNNNNEDLSAERIPKLIEEHAKKANRSKLLAITQEQSEDSRSSTPARRDDDDDHNIDDNEDEEVDAVKTPVPTPCLSPIQDTPIDLSMRSLSDRSSSSPSAISVRSAASVSSEISDYDNRLSALRLVRSIPVDLTNKA